MRHYPVSRSTTAQTADLAAARAAQLRIARASDVGAARWPRVNAVRDAMTTIRRENHLREDIETIFRGHP